MLELPNVTLLCADCIHVERGIAALEQSRKCCTFGAVRLLTHQPVDYPHVRIIEPLRSIVDYSIFMLKQAYKYIATSHVLVVQHDGWVLNPESWRPEWHQLDFIGPLYIHKHPITARSMGTGGFSFRSKRLMEYVNSRVPEWTGTDEQATQRLQDQLGAFEDGVITLNLRTELECNGFKFASPEQAAKFAQGGQNDPRYYEARPFGFHGKWDNIGYDTGIVAPPPFTCGGREH